MVLSNEDLEFVATVNDLLNKGLTPQEIADKFKTPMSTLRSRIDRLGYEIQIDRSLVPKRAPDLDSI
jgi:hypothetical protein